MKINIGGVNIDSLTMEQAVSKIDFFITEKTVAAVVTPNVDHVVRYNRDKIFRDIYQRADLVLADGVPLIWASKILKTPLPEKISGSDLLPELCRYGAGKKYRVFLLGGRPGAAVKAAEILEKNNPGLIIAGTCCPSYGFENNAEESSEILHMIQKAEPDILFAGLGSPKQEIWIDRNKNIINVPVCLGIGVTFEFIAGMVKRAPLWMQKSGLEWFWRLLMEPGRLWKRYIVDDTYFFVILIKQLFRRKK